MSLGAERLSSFGGGNVWFKGADGERQAMRVDSRDTHRMYSVIEFAGESPAGSHLVGSDEAGMTANDA